MTERLGFKRYFSFFPVIQVAAYRIGFPLIFVHNTVFCARFLGAALGAHFTRLASNVWPVHINTSIVVALSETLPSELPLELQTTLSNAPFRTLINNSLQNSLQNSPSSLRQIPSTFFISCTKSPNKIFADHENYMQKDNIMQYPLGLGMGDLVGVGITAFVGRLDAVVKFSKPSEHDLMERERLVYQRLGRDHCGILRYFGAIDNALVLQYACHGSIRQYFAMQQKAVPLSLKLKWVEQLADVLCFIHSRNVLHGDISCNNVFLDEQLSVKLGDFAGSAIDDLPRLICYETSHELPEQEDISKRSELFALGSTIYEIMTGSKPHSGLSDEEVCAAFTEGRYPDLESLAAFKGIIVGCWKQSYTNADEVLDDVKSEVTKNSKPHSTLVDHLYSFPLVLTFLSLFPFALWKKSWNLLNVC